MRKIISLLLILVLALSFSGCSSTDFSANDILPDDSSPVVKAHGIDVSKWQGKINWEKVKNDGVDFAMIRIGYRGEDGKLYKDEYADYNIQKALEQGLLIGAYFFSTATTKKEAEEEATFCAENIKYYPISYPVAYNCEGYDKQSSRMFNLTTTARTENAIAFLNKIKSYGYDPMMYSSVKEYILYWNTTLLEKNFKIWVARYSSPTYPEVTTPSYSGKYDMWQYSNTGAVKGIKGNTDMIVSYFLPKSATAKSQDTPPVATLPSK